MFVSFFVIKHCALELYYFYGRKFVDNLCLITLKRYICFMCLFWLKVRARVFKCYFYRERWFESEIDFLGLELRRFFKVKTKKILLIFATELLYKKRVCINLFWIESCHLFNVHNFRWHTCFVFMYDFGQKSFYLILRWKKCCKS